MKSKKANHESSDDSEESAASVESISSSDDSPSDISSTLERSHRAKKKRKRANTSESDSDSDGAYRKSKKRKHKKKKRRHSKKKRRDDSDEESGSEEVSSASNDISHKKKRKHKHKHKLHKRSRSSSDSEQKISGKEQDCRLQSVIAEPMISSEDEIQPKRTYYQKEYRRSPSVGKTYESRHMPEEERRVHEVDRFYRGSSRERPRPPYQEQNNFDRQQNRRYENGPPPRNDRNHERYHHQEHNGSQEYNARRQMEFAEYSRKGQFEQKPNVDYRRVRDNEPVRKHYHGDGNNRGYPQRQEGPGRDYRIRREAEQPPVHGQRFRGREFQDRRVQYPDMPAHPERSRDMPRELPDRQDKPPPRDQRERPKSQSPPKRSVEHTRRLEDKRLRDEEQFKERRAGDGLRGREERPREDRSRAEKPREERLREERPREERPREERPREERPREDKGERNVRVRTSKEASGSRDRNISRDKSFKNEGKSSPKERQRKSRFNEAEGKEYNWGKTEVKQEGKDKAEKEKPNFGLSGKLTAEANTVDGVVIKYTEPEDAKQPKRRWRFYPFKGDKALPILYIHRQSSFLMGREKKVADIHLEHPSVSKQHAALQFRATPFARPDGTQGRRVRPYVIDLESANGTFVNNTKIEPRRYVELMERDVVKFGFSQREYVLLHENSKDDAQDDDQGDAPPTTVTQVRRERRARQEMLQDGD